MLSTLMLYLLVPTVLSWIVYKHFIFPLYLSPLSKIPSTHPSTPLSALWLRYQRRGERTLFRTLTAAHKKHGPIIRLAPNEISVASLEGLRKIYVGGFEKPEWYGAFSNFNTPNLFSTLASKPHSVQKRMLSHVYSKSYIQNSPDLAKTTHAVLRRFLILLKDRGDVNVAVLEWNQALGADLTSAYQFGSENGTKFVTDEAHRKKFFETWDARMKGGDGVAEMGRARTEIEANVMGWIRQTEVSLRQPLDEEIQTQAVVYEQFSNALEKSRSSHNDKEAIIASEMLDEFFAGTEASKITISYLQWELSKRPELQKSLRQELMTLSPSFDTLMGSDVSSQTSKLPDAKSLDELPLLDALLRETMRLYTPSPPLFTRTVPPGGTVLEGYEIPAGTLVGTSAPVMHMNESVYPDAASFKPERWLVDGPQRVEMLKWFWAFGSGGRMCIGSHLALYILKAVTAAVYTNFETEIVDDGGPGGMEQRDNIVADPVGNKLILKFRPVKQGL